MSREVVVRRLLELDLVTKAFYQSKRKQYAAEVVDRQRKKEDEPSRDFKINMPVLALRSVGKSFAFYVLRAMHEGRVTESAAAGFLGVQTKHFDKIEKLVFGRAE